MKSFLLTVFIFFSFKAFSNNTEVPELEIEKLTDGVYIHKSFQVLEKYGIVSSNGLIAVENKHAFIIDTPWSAQDTESLVKWIKSKGYTLIGSVSTHFHEDRTAGIKWLNDHKIPTYASKLTNQILEKKGKQKAQISFSGRAFNLPESALETYFPGEGHTIDNIVIWLPSSNTLFGGCLVRDLTENLGYLGDAHTKAWPATIKQLLKKYPNVNLVVPGHGDVGSQELLHHTLSIATKHNS